MRRWWTYRRSLSDEAGQAITEYAIIVGGLLGVLVGVGFTFLPDFIQALQDYYNGFYIIISLPIP